MLLKALESMILNSLVITTRGVRPPNGGRFHLHEPPSPVSTARPMWLTSGRISHEAVYAGRAGLRAAAARARWLYVTMGYTKVVAVALTILAN